MFRKDNFQESIFEHVSNTYLVFRKIKEEFPEYLYSDEKDDEILNKELVKRIRNICEFNITTCNINPSLIETLKKFKDFTIVKEFFSHRSLEEDYYLLLLEYGSNRILLNYLQDPKDFAPVKWYYVADIPEKDVFSSNIRINDENYYIINTFDAFIDFADLNGLPKIRDTNGDFYDSFIEALQIRDMKIGNKAVENGTLGSCTSISYSDDKLHRYTYAVLDDVIIVLGYEKRDLE